MLISETYIDKTRGVRFGDSGEYEPFTEDRGKLFKSLSREYGRCTGKVYIDTSTGSTPIGWVFEKRMAYEDARKPTDTYVREVWVTLHKQKTTVTRTPHYAEVTA